MHLATVFIAETQIVVARLDDANLLNLTASIGVKDMLTLIDGGPSKLNEAREALSRKDGADIIPIDSVTFCAPIPRPEQMRDFVSFEAHLINAYNQIEKTTGQKTAIPQVWYDQPIYYKCNRFSVIGDGQDVRWPDFAEVMDFELELAAVIGKGGVNISADDAPSHIFGYTIYNDVTARDAQFAEMKGQMGPAKGKDFDTGNVLGPFIVTADEIPHPAKLNMEARINGERWGGGTSASMHHNFADIIAHLSRSETLHAGEVIGSGTVGTGCGLEQGRYLSDGDTIELTIEKIGTLTNILTKG